MYGIPHSIRLNLNVLSFEVLWAGPLAPGGCAVRGSLYATTGLRSSSTLAPKASQSPRHPEGSAVAGQSSALGD